MLGIVVVVYKSYQDTVRFIKTEISKISTPFKLVIVDNGATMAESRKLAESCGAELVVNQNTADKNKDIFLISTSENLGYAKGNNLGTSFLNQHFAVDYILFSNNDIVLKDVEVCDKLIDRLDKTENVGMVGPRVIGSRQEDQSPHYEIKFIRYFAWVILPFLKGKIKFLRKNRDNSPAELSEGYCYWVSGCFFMLRKKDFMDAGMFDSNTFLYGEEKILAERLLGIGKYSYYDPSVVVFHEHGNTTKKHIKNKQIEKMVFDSDCYYFREYKHISPIFLNILKLFN